MAKVKLILDENNDIKNLYSKTRNNTTSNIIQNANFKPKVKILPTPSNKNIFNETLKTVGSTTADLLTNVGKGFLGAVESGVDAGRYAVAGIADVIGADEYAQKVRKNAEFDVTGWLTKDADELYNKKSVLKEGGTIESVAQGVGQVGAMVGTSALMPAGAQSVKLGKLSIPTTSLITGTGSGITEARKDGATEGQALLYGGLKGVIEGATEGMFGGLGKTFQKITGGGALDEVVAKKLSSNISNKVLSNLVNAGVMSIGEGTEEVVSSVLDPIAKKIYSDKSLKELYKDTNLFEDFIVGTLTSAILQAPSTITNINQENNISNKELSSINKTTDYLQKYKVSEDYSKEIQNKTSKNIENMTNVEMTPIENVLELKQNGGYRTNEEIERLINNVKKNGIQNPIELVKNIDGTIKIVNGNHRLEVANILGLKEVPVKYVKDYIANLPTTNYNKSNIDYVEGDYRNGSITSIEGIVEDNENYRNIKRGGNNNSEISYNGQTDERNDKIYQELGRYNNRPPSNTTRAENSLSSTNEELNNSSFFTEIKENNNIKILPTNKNLNPNEISQLNIEGANTTPILPNIKVSTGDGESKFYKNITEKTKMLDEDTRTKLLGEKDIEYYQNVTNEVDLEKAFNKLNDGGSNETLNWFSKPSESATSVDIAEGWILLKQYSDSGNYDGVVQVAKKMREMGTKAGQTVQAFNILSRLTPEGMVKYAQSELSEAYEKMIKNKSQKWIDEHKSDFDLKPEEVKFIMDIMQEVSQMEEGYNKKVKLAEIQKLMTDKLPPDKGAGTKAWMRISMLFNPKTQIRNVAGNAIIAPVNALSDLVASKVDKTIANKTGVRTTGATNIKNYAKGFKQGFYQSYNDFKKGINTRNIEGNRFEIGQGKSFNNKTSIGKALNNVDSLLSFMLDAGDRTFYEAIFTNSINNQLILNKTTEVTKEMIDIATNEALQRTWQDNNNYTKFVLNVRKMLNNINVRGYGLGDVLIPFAKTPANLTKAIIDYSPAGLINTVISGNNLRKSLSNGQYTPEIQHKFVQNLGKATAGTMLYILGYALAKCGVVSGKSDDDKDVANFLKNTLGISSYSIKIGDKSFTYDWAQPVAAPLSIMANVVNSKKNKEIALYEAIIGSLDTAGSILLEQSFLQSINDVLNDNDGIVSGLITEILELPARAIPTLSKQIADMVDGTQRQTFEYDKPVKSALNYSISKIPFASKTLSPSVDTMGREIQKYGGKNNIFNVFLNPANVNSENISESAKEIYKIYQKTGNASVMPRQTGYYINPNGIKTIFTSTQRSKFQKVSGNIIEDNVKKLKNKSEYKQMSSTDKSEVIANIVNYAYNKAREDVLGIAMSSQYNKVNEWISNGNTIYDYYLNKYEADYSLENPEKYNTITKLGVDYNDYLAYQKEVNNIKEEYSGAENSNLRKQKVFEYINSLSYNKNQKTILFNLLGNYSISQSKQALFEYINKQDITKKEKEEIWNYLYK